MTKVVVTGATGFLGRYTVARLASIPVTIVSVSRSAHADLHRVDDYAQTPGGDIVIHLAEERDRAKVNILGESYVRDSGRVVQALAHRFKGRIVYASSAVVYGDQYDSPCGVATTVRAADSYTSSKISNERIVLDSGGTVVRFSNLFGSGMAVNNVMSNILDQIPGEGPLRVRDDTPVIDFLSVVDAASALPLLIGGNHAGIFNVGSGVGTTVRRLAELSLAAAGQGTRAIIPAVSSSRKSFSVLDISETKRILGWSPTVSLEDHLARLLGPQVPLAK